MKTFESTSKNAVWSVTTMIDLSNRMRVESLAGNPKRAETKCEVEASCGGPCKSRDSQRSRRPQRTSSNQKNDCEYQFSISDATICLAQKSLASLYKMHCRS